MKKTLYKLNKDIRETKNAITALSKLGYWLEYHGAYKRLFKLEKEKENLLRRKK